MLNCFPLHQIPSLRAARILLSLRYLQFLSALAEPTQTPLVSPGVLVGESLPSLELAAQPEDSSVAPDEASSHDANESSGCLPKPAQQEADPDASFLSALFSLWCGLDNSSTKPPSTCDQTPLEAQVPLVSRSTFSTQLFVWAFLNLSNQRLGRTLLPDPT